ncbi:MAG: polysaccharide deacetylase family protein [Pseudomonadota bacterium]
MNRYSIKRDVLRATGMLGYLWKKITPGLYVFNYHRIGNPDETPFDPNIYSCDEIHFAKQIAAIRDRFKIIQIKELLEIIASGRPLQEPMAMITFDDGYRGNYENAFPILLAEKVPGLFFLPTSYISCDHIPWWDEVAWLIKNTKHQVIKLPGSNQSVTVDPQNIKQTIRTVLTRIKNDSDLPLAEKIRHMRTACGCEMPLENSNLFMTWEQAAEMQQAGMEIGSHGHSHEILSHLSAEEQRSELMISKNLIEENINVPVEAIAYPVGGRPTYTEETCRIAKECGYKLGFTFVPGFNRNPASVPFELLRIPVEDNWEPYDLKYSAVFSTTDE